jgi:hypothetical protein
MWTDNAGFLAQGLGYDFIGVDVAKYVTYGELVASLEEADLSTSLEELESLEGLKSLEGLEDLQNSHGLAVSCFDNLLFVHDVETGWQLHVFDAERSLARIAYFEEIGIPISFTRISDNVIAMTVVGFASDISITISVVDLDTQNVLLSPFDWPRSGRDWITLSLDNYILVHQYVTTYKLRPDSISSFDGEQVDLLRDITYYLFELQGDTVVQIATCEPVLIPEDGNDQFSPYALLSPGGLIVPSYTNPKE